MLDPLILNGKVELSSLEDSLKDSDLLLLFVGHDNFKDVDFNIIYRLMRNKNIFDTRNFYDAEVIKNAGFNYYRI